MKPERIRTCSLLILLALISGGVLGAGCTSTAPLQTPCGIENVTDLFPHGEDTRQYEAGISFISATENPWEISPVWYSFRISPDLIQSCKRYYSIHYAASNTSVALEAPRYDLGVFEFDSPRNASQGMKIIVEEMSSLELNLTYKPIEINDVTVYHYSQIMNGSPAYPRVLQQHFFFWNKDRLGFLMRSDSFSERTDLYNESLALIDRMMSVCRNTYDPSKVTSPSPTTAAGPCIVPDTTDVDNLRIDTRVILKTPYWVELLASQEDQKGMIDYINRANIVPEKKKEWIAFLQKMWNKYPTTLRKVGEINLLTLCAPVESVHITPEENSTFREIHDYISEDIVNSANQSVPRQV